ncbi:MAG: NHLP family bacteriocin export ABC transporter peptidase/permease/ATPase subunit [Hyphomicrobiales bacterium]|nr:MAG: NHLP family bacteriocin export ABC transporter peptidase/permease/ATPase subunit [Hyphomicrobiales bacterium]
MVAAGRFQHRIRRTPTVLQLEAAECGAAALAMVLAAHGRYIALENLRIECGISRDGSKASSIVKAARSHGLEAKGMKAEPEHLKDLPLPAIAFVDFCHFLVVEGYGPRHVFLNDPAGGRRKVTHEAFDAMFTGVILTFTPTERFEKSDQRPNLKAALFARTKGLRLGIAFVFLTSLALVIPGIVIPIFSRVFVDQILVRGYGDWLLPLLAGMLITSLLRLGLSEMQRAQLIQARTRLAVRETKALFQHILKLPIAYFGTRYAGEVAGRLGLSGNLASLLTGDIASMALSLITATFFLVLMFAYSATITMVILGFTLLNILVVILTTRIASEGYRKLSIEGGKLSGIGMAGLKDIETYKAAGAEDAFFARWAGLNAQIVTLRQALRNRLLPVATIPSLLQTWTAATILILGGYEVMNGQMTIGTLVAFQSLGASFIGPVITLTGLVSTFQEVRSLTERMEDVLRHPVDPVFETDTGTVDRLPVGELRLNQVSFGYLPLEMPLIDKLDINVKAGGRIALIGASGSGKSTVGRLMAGLLPPGAGQVLIDGRPATEWPRPALASRLSYVDQEIVLFEGSIRDNLTMWDTTISEAQMMAAAKDALIHDVICSRPGTYDSQVIEGGANFSGGQRQRLEIARALATNPCALVMDEATSALDTIAEAEIMENIRARGTTLIIIAHRLSTIRDCDEIIVLDRGKPVDRGTHDELLAKDGLYTSLIED